MGIERHRGVAVWAVRTDEERGVLEAIHKKWKERGLAPYEDPRLSELGVDNVLLNRWTEDEDFFRSYIVRGVRSYDELIELTRMRVIEST